MAPPWEVGKKVYINGTGHMTKMAVMLIHGKNLQKSNRPRYQVSVYRTIGPLVIISVSVHPKEQIAIANDFPWQGLKSLLFQYRTCFKT